MREVSAAEFARNLSEYSDIVQHEPVAVTREGRPTSYFVSADEFAEMQRLKVLARRSRAIVELTQAEIEEMTSGHMAPEHDRLNALLDGD